MATTKRIYFYTTERPHGWTSGPIVHKLDTDYEPIKSVARAKELALKAQRDSGEPGTSDWVDVSWGTMYEERKTYSEYYKEWEERHGQGH